MRGPALNDDVDRGPGASFLSPEWERRQSQDDSRPSCYVDPGAAQILWTAPSLAEAERKYESIFGSVDHPTVTGGSTK